MAIEELVKGELDWHKKVNANFKKVTEGTDNVRKLAYKNEAILKTILPTVVVPVYTEIDRLEFGNNVNIGNQLEERYDQYINAMNATINNGNNVERTILAETTSDMDFVFIGSLHYCEGEYAMVNRRNMSFVVGKGMNNQQDDNIIISYSNATGINVNVMLSGENDVMVVSMVEVRGILVGLNINQSS